MAKAEVSSLSQYAETITPQLESEYDVPVGIPDFLGGHRKGGIGMQYVPADEYRQAGGSIDQDERAQRRQTHGAVKVRAIPRTVFGRVGMIAHEFGHAALYQNSDFFELRQDDAYDDTVLSGISEAVAQDFERYGKRQYVQNNVGTESALARSGGVLQYTGSRTVGRVIDAVTPAEEDEYVFGRQILREYGSDIVNKAIDDPESVYDTIVADMA